MTGQFDFYDYGPLLSRGAMINMIVGGRGVGKTYGAKMYVLNQYLKKGAEFIYLRRYKTELSAARGSFLADLPAEIASQFEVKGSLVLWCENPEEPDRKKRRYRKAGYFVALSTAMVQKSVAFPKVRTIIFDEVVLVPGSSIRYLSGELVAFLEFFNTVDRYQNRVRAILLGNAGSIACPYFAGFGIPLKGGEFRRGKTPDIIAHFPASGTFGEQVKQTRFGQLMRAVDESYEAYAIGNEFGDGGDELLLEKRPKGSMYQYTVIFAAGELSFYRYDGCGLWATTERPRGADLYTTEAELADETIGYAPLTGPRCQSSRWAFNAGNLRFASPAARSIFISSNVR